MYPDFIFPEKFESTEYTSAYAPPVGILTLKTLKSFRINHGDQSVLSI